MRWCAGPGQQTTPRTTPDICHGTTCIKGHFRPHLNERRLGAMNAEATPALQATNIHQSFGHVDALRGVDLTLMPGEIVALLGVNGAGKSTFLDIVLGLATLRRATSASTA